MKIKEVDIPIYFGKLVLILTDNLEKVNDKYKTKIVDDLYDAVVFEVVEEDRYILAVKKLSWSVVAHEITHIVNLIFLKCGIELDRINDEPQAYLTGWVTSEVEKFLEEVLDNYTAFNKEKKFYLPKFDSLDFKQMREEKTLTPKQVEEKAGVSNSYLSQLETGKITNPSYSVVYKLLELYQK